MPNKILVIRLSSLGDVVLTAPVFKNLKAFWPDCSISVLVKPQFAPALEGNPHISEIIPFSGMRTTLRRVREGRFTHLLDLHDNLRSLIIRKLSGVLNVSVYRKNALARRLFVAFGLNSPVLQKHTVDKYLHSLAGWGVPITHTSLDLNDQREGRKPLSGISAKNILIIQSAFLGDSLLTLPLARDVKARFPQSRLSVLTLPGTADIFRGSPWVDDLILDDKRGEHSGPRGLWNLSRVLKARRFDLAIIPHRSFRSALLGWLSGIPQRIGFSTSAGRLFLTRTVAFSWPMHDLERNLSLLLPLSPDLNVRKDESKYITSDAAADAAMRDRLKAAGVAPADKVIGIHPGSAWPTKRWLAERFTELSLRFEKKGFRVILIGGKQDRELCENVARGTRALDWAGETDLKDLKSLMGRLSLFVTNDSGPMHVATASGVPTLALFGPTTRELGFFPYGPRHRVLEADLACRPCGLHGGKYCPEGHFLCMKLITVDEAWQNAMAMLEIESNAGTEVARR